MTMRVITYCKDGNMEKALALYSRMIEKGVQPDVVTFSILIDGFGKLGDPEGAIGVYTELNIKGLKPDFG
ncbi:Pentatricopeptide repeat-containing protein [Capsicum baccatum]|uniref:Pentatricopeptide repeat-containing protein n=1 Tax=Capsicum baccatum TaxID=33114 RepID=A0A2G2VTB0_CAPBA|nr:Pentatricopeptide repeat-containing protein [Capsicum baccatum]